MSDAQSGQNNPLDGANDSPLFYERSITRFLSDLSSGEPVPGGGAGAALAGATGAALISMVANLTLGREKYASSADVMRATLERAEKWREELLDLLQADTQAYTGVISAYRLPRASDEEKRARRDAIQRALINACDVPLRTARVCAKLIALGPAAAAKGNPNAVSDAGVGVLLALAAFESGAQNVEINLVSIKDQTFVKSARSELAELRTGANANRDETLRLVSAVINK